VSDTTDDADSTITTPMTFSTATTAMNSSVTPGVGGFVDPRWGGRTVARGRLAVARLTVRPHATR
jgi:hypothetical protein